MRFGYFSYPMPANEPVLSYAPGSPEKAKLKQALADLKKQTLDIPMFIGGKAVKTGKKVSIHPPHETAHTLGHFHAGEEKHVMALQAAEARERVCRNRFVGVSDMRRIVGIGDGRGDVIRPIVHHAAGIAGGAGPGKRAW